MCSPRAPRCSPRSGCTPAALPSAYSQLDVAVCEELGAAVELYAAHVLSLADACVTVAKGLTATGRTVDGKAKPPRCRLPSSPPLPIARCQ